MAKFNNVLSISGDAKTVKGETYGYLTGVCYLIPDEKLCPFMSPECHALCLRESGHLRFEITKRVARAKVELFRANPEEFKLRLIANIHKLVKKASKRKLKPAVRFNGTSDVYFHKLFRDVIEAFPDVQFYDYTKRPPQSWGKLPANYHLTFSLSETNAHHAMKALDMGFNVAVPFHYILPTTYMGRPVIDGDASDLRFLDHLQRPMVNDGKGMIVGLTAKGIARKAIFGKDHFIK